MIAALNNTTTVNGPGATTGQTTRVRENDGLDTAEASAVVSVSAQAVSLAAASNSAATATASGVAPASTTTNASTTEAPVAATASTTTTEQPLTLVPNLIYAKADSDQNGVVSPAERRAYDIVHPELGARAAETPPRRVVEAELREYTSIANTRS